MQPRGLSAALFLVLLILITGLVVGCGGGDQTQQGGGNGGAEKQGGEAGKQDGEAGKKRRGGLKLKIALGTITNVIDEREKFILNQTRGEQIPFKLEPRAEIKLNDKEAQFEDMEKGQQAQVEYVVRQGLPVPNRARTIELFSGGDE